MKLRFTGASCQSGESWGAVVMVTSRMGRRAPAGECLMRSRVTLSPVIPSVPCRGFECLVLVLFTLHGEIVLNEHTV